MMKNCVNPIIGLEVHVELKTLSKMFCGCSADYFGHEPNTHCCPVCLGLPGALPVPNKKAVEWCILLGLALNCQVNEESYFERKNYFYPDLPKGYQISQYTRPLCFEGQLVIARSVATKQSEKIATLPSVARNDKLKIRFNRVHMEEDTGKLTHATSDGERVSLVDFNRSGVPLVEIVTEPDFTSTEDVILYLKKLQQIIRYLGISDADMEKGSMRLEPTINLKITKNKKVYETPLIEIKNINSFRFVKQALEYEMIRQQTEFTKNQEVKAAGNKTTVGFDENKKVTVPQRLKEEANDYRYFPEPDIPPMQFSKSQISNLKSQIGELPDEKIARIIKVYGLSEYDAIILCESREGAEYYEESIKVLKYKSIKEVTPNMIANWIINKRVDTKKVTPADLVKMIVTATQTISISDEELEKIVKAVISKNSKAVAEYQAGKEQAMMFLIGQVMRETKGKADSGKVKNILQKIIIIN